MTAENYPPPCETLTTQELAAEALELLIHLPLRALAVLAGNRADVPGRLDEVLTRLAEALPEERDEIELALHCVRLVFERAGVSILEGVRPTLARLAAGNHVEN